MTKKKDPKDLLPGGRPTLYDPKYCTEIVAYFDVEPYREVQRENKNGQVTFVKEANELPTLAGFAAKLGIARETLFHWGKAHPNFFNAVTRAKAMGERILVTNALLGLYNPQFAVFVAKNYTNMRDVKDVNVSNVTEAVETPDQLEAEIRNLDNKIAGLETRH